LKFIGDFHTHSHYSIATSRELVPEFFHYWAAVKGITVVGTGDFTHPGWIRELKEKLVPAEKGLFKLKGSLKREVDKKLAFAKDRDVGFMLTAEISNIYKSRGSVKKVHNLIFAPGFETVQKIQDKLLSLGANITSDGRPIIGMDSRDLLELALDVSEDIFFVPAHIWTPWFSALGEKSGFNTIEDCYRDLSHHIHAVETGLSTDAPMNWMCSFLDKYTLISNSDAHSPEKLGRNANIFDTELSFDAITRAMKRGSSGQFLGTIDMFPQEGKYHYAGHRKCSVSLDPVETLQNNGLCPKCGKRVVMGVMNRVVQLSDREDIEERETRLPFYSVITLKKLLSEILGVSPDSGAVKDVYEKIIRKGRSELGILLDTPLHEIGKLGGEMLEEGIRRMREGEVYIDEGADGEYGTVKVFDERERGVYTPQTSLFNSIDNDIPERKRRKLLNFSLEEFRKLEKDGYTLVEKELYAGEGKIAAAVHNQDLEQLIETLNHEQKTAALHGKGPAVVLAGPGTGKTRVLTLRIANLIRKRGVLPETILALTFTNKAAGEMRERLISILGNGDVQKVKVATFHSLGLSILKEQYEIAGRKSDFFLLDEDDKKRIIEKTLKCDRRKVALFSEEISKAKQQILSFEDIENPEVAQLFRKYSEVLRYINAFDLDDLIYYPVKIFEEHGDILEKYQEKYSWILVDEYQDINWSQYQMIKSLAPDENSNLYVIGDPNQAIYGFRGADSAIIDRFIEEYENASLHRLKISYRCSDTILEASSGVLGESSFQRGVKKGVEIKIVKNQSGKSEAEFIARTIESMIGGVRFFSMDSSISDGDGDDEIETFSDFAILCRVKSQMDDICKALDDHSIPYQTVGEISFLKEEPVSLVIDVFRLLEDPENSFLKEKVTAKGSFVPSSIYDKVIGKSVSQILLLIIDECFPGKKQEHGDRLKRLLDYAEKFDQNNDAFLNAAVLGTGVDSYLPELERVTVMTLHASKGLEFQAVFISGCEAGLIPYSLFKKRVAPENEERRLLYVGMTRAKKYLFLTHAERRLLQGREYKSERTPFLKRINDELTTQSEIVLKNKRKHEKSQLSLF